MQLIRESPLEREKRLEKEMEIWQKEKEERERRRDENHRLMNVDEFKTKMQEIDKDILTELSGSEKEIYFNIISDVYSITIDPIEFVKKYAKRNFLKRNNLIISCIQYHETKADFEKAVCSMKEAFKIFKNTQTYKDFQNNKLKKYKYPELTAKIDEGKSLLATFGNGGCLYYPDTCEIPKEIVSGSLDHPVWWYEAQMYSDTKRINDFTNWMVTEKDKEDKRKAKSFKAKIKRVFRKKEEPEVIVKK